MPLPECTLDAHVQRVPGEVEVGDLIGAEAGVEGRVCQGVRPNVAFDDELSL